MAVNVYHKSQVTGYEDARDIKAVLTEKMEDFRHERGIGWKGNPCIEHLEKNWQKKRNLRRGFPSGSGSLRARFKAKI